MQGDDESRAQGERHSDPSGNPSATRPASRWRLLVLGGAYVAVIASVYLVPPGPDRVRWIIIASLAGFAVYLAALRWAGSGRGSVAVVIGVGLALRLVLLPATPSTSDDVYRYLWEGLVQLDGHNPYAEAPLDATLASLRAAHPDLVDRVNHPDSPTIYGPLAEWSFLAAAWLAPDSLIAWKLVLLFFESVVVAVLLIAWNRPAAPPAKLQPSDERTSGASWPVPGASRPVPGPDPIPNRSGRDSASAPDRVLLLAYLWCPLVVFETYEAGHVDLLGAGLLVLAWTWRSRCWWASGLMLGGSIAIKYFWPLLVVPLLLREVRGWRRRGATVILAGATAGALFLPYWGGQGALASVCGRFLEHWRYGGPFMLIEYFLPGPQWSPFVVTGGVLLLAIGLLTWRAERPGWPEVQLALGTGLILGPVIYPWYLVWLTPGLVWRRGVTWLTWVGLACLWHEVQIGYQTHGVWRPNAWLTTTTMILFCALLVLEWRRWFVRLR